AGLPNEFGTHDEQPADTSAYLREFAEHGLVNVVGGCCGTTPEHVRAISDAIRGQTPRVVPKRQALTAFSGLEPFTIFPDANFVMVGERTNVTRSARFRRLIEAGDFQGAVEVALEQGRGGPVERKVAICERAYRLLTDDGWAPEDLIFDSNVLAVATGIEEHSEYANAFIEAAGEIKRRCPGAKLSGGISNLSFSFR